ncbi:hypothetical protein [Streptomyces halstedii]|uniref:hypothetical protein n=1 Tax=Streptomyces halstedii TaxID=1944 RepID=UPI0036BEE0BE
MPESVLSAVQIGVIGALAAWMITGFTSLPGRWLRWRMFCPALVEDRLPHRRLQYAVPGLVRRHAGNLGERDVRLWRLVAAATVLAEIALPPALLVPQTMPYAVAAGITMHAAFTCLKPRQLVTFSGLTTGTYAALRP